MSQVKLNPNETKDFLRHILRNNEIIQAEGKTPVAVEITGEAGLNLK